MKGKSRVVERSRIGASHFANGMTNISTVVGQRGQRHVFKEKRQSAATVGDLTRAAETQIKMATTIQQPEEREIDGIARPVPNGKSTRTTNGRMKRKSETE